MSTLDGRIEEELPCRREAMRVWLDTMPGVGGRALRFEMPGEDIARNTG